MGAYHQVGHHSLNLINDPNLADFAGAILSPTNYTEIQLTAQIADHEMINFDYVFDPQLYFPRTQRGELTNWGYFPQDVDTVDHSDARWWTTLIRSVIATAVRIGCGSACVPCIVPRSYQNSFYRHCVERADEFHRLADGMISSVMTLLVDYDDIALVNRAVEISSIISSSSVKRVYLVIASNQDPRRELASVESLVGLIRLIRFLEAAEVEVTVGYTSTDLLLWKFASATHCATGKFFNLRRFTPSRWDDPTGGGGQLAYWIEEALMAYLRESDVIRIFPAIQMTTATPYNAEIFDKIAIGDPWLATSWKHYLHWFCSMEDRLSRGLVDPRRLLSDAEANSLVLEDSNILLEEARNNFSWLRPWRRALAEA